MSTVMKYIDAKAHWQVARFVVNGVVAAAVHFGVLSFGLLVLHIPSAGVANLVAAIAGITTSFFGSRYLVFQAQSDPWIGQLARFGLLYVCVAVLHTVVLWVWTDLNHLDYRVGFILATMMQMLLSFAGNKFLVFKR